MYFNPEHYYPFLQFYSQHIFNFELTQNLQQNPLYLFEMQFNNRSNVKINISERNNLSNTVQSSESSQNPYCIIQKRIRNNSISSILRLFLRRIKAKTESFQTLILQIINKHKMDLTVKNFQTWLEQLEINHRIYLTLQTANKYFYGKQTHLECYKVMRILFEKFIRTESLLCYFTSKKTKKQDLQSFLVTLRTIGKELFNLNGK